MRVAEGVDVAERAVELARDLAQRDPLRGDDASRGAARDARVAGAVEERREPAGLERCAALDQGVGPVEGHDEARLRVDEVRIRANRLGKRLRVDVYDRSKSELHPLAGSIRPAPGSQSGWGLYLVDRLADRWGTERGVETKVWAEFMLPA